MKRIARLVAMLLLLIGLCACGASTEAQWQEQYDLGVRYLSEGNYEEAVIAFTAAIEIDPKRPEAYNGAADAYIGLGNYEKAYDILAQGQAQCGELENFTRRMSNIDFLQSGETGIRITDFYFDHEAYLAGNETEFLVSVAYRCPEGQDCVLMIGANTEEPDSFAMMDEDYHVTGSGGYQFYVSAIPIQWEESYFGIYVNLSEADHAETWTPLSADILYIDSTGSIVGGSVDTGETYRTDALVAEIDNPLLFDEVTFLGESIENLNIETARSLIKLNFSDVSERGFDDDNNTWWISGCNGRGPDVSAMQNKTEDYVCIWTVESSLRYSDREQLRTVRDIYTHDTLSEVLVKLGVTNGAQIADYVKGIVGKEYASSDELREKMDFIQWPWYDGMSMSIGSGGGYVTDSGGCISTEVTVIITYRNRDSGDYVITFHFGENSYAEYMYQFVDYLDEMSVYILRD